MEVDNTIQQMEYKDYIDKWLSGLYHECAWWNQFMLQEFTEYSSTFNAVVSSDKKFTLTSDLPQKERVTVLDVGCGPFSRIGRICDDKEISIIGVDPLADIYIKLKEKYHLQNGLRLESGFVELLDKRFEKNSFDIVHMSNSLDHSFDAVMGIYMLLYVCKIGGKVILRHHENEAEKDKYVGLHQWNLLCHNDENSFVIWRQRKRFDICKIFDEYAYITIEKDISEEDTGWVYNKVVLQKKKDVVLPKNHQYDSAFFNEVYSYLLQLILNNVYISDIVDQRDIEYGVYCTKRITEVECDGKVVLVTTIQDFENVRQSIKNIKDSVTIIDIRNFITN